jgi:hypothetical protein
MRVMMSLGSIVLFALGLGGMIISRRGAGVLHLLRGVVGVVAVFATLQALGAQFMRVQPWPAAASQMREGLPGAAVQGVLEAVAKEQVVGMLGVIVIAAILIAWPSRTREPSELDGVAS